MAIWIFFQIWLEMPIHAPKISVLGVWNPKRDWSLSRPPKGTSLAGTALTCQFWYISVHRCDLCARRRNQKRKKARKETYSCKLGVRPDHPRWRSDMWSCMPGGLRQIVLSFKFRQNRLKGFLDVGGRNLQFPISRLCCAKRLQATFLLFYRTDKKLIITSCW